MQFDTNCCPIIQLPNIKTKSIPRSSLPHPVEPQAPTLLLPWRTSIRLDSHLAAATRILTRDPSFIYINLPSPLLNHTFPKSKRIKPKYKATTKTTLKQPWISSTSSPATTRTTTNKAKVKTKPSSKNRRVEAFSAVYPIN